VATCLAWVLLVRGDGEQALAGGHVDHAVQIVVMVMATMGLFAVPVVRTVASTSPWWRARRAVVIAFTAFVGTWFGVALWLHGVAESLFPLLGSAQVVAGVLVAACAGAALRPGRSRRVVRCGRPVPLRRDGWGADLDCARSGLVAALWCARLCAVPMLAMLALPGRVDVMAALPAIGLAERAGGPGARLPVSLAYAALSVAVLVL
jgi:hypothetical protein